MAKEFDLMVIDHPHIGESVAAGALLLMDRLGRDDSLADLAANSVGPSYESYRLDARQ